MAGQRVRISLQSFDSKMVDKSTEIIVAAIKDSGVKVAGPIPLPTRIKKITVLKSPHVNVTARNQYEMRIYKRLIDIYDASNEAMNLLGTVELPIGVDIKIRQ